MASPSGIGIEIGEDEIRIVRLQRTPHGAALRGLGSHATPPGAVSGGMVRDARLLAEGLKTALRSSEIRGSEAVVGLPSRAASSRVLELPVMARQEMATVVAGEMEHYRMIPQNQGTFDFIALGEAASETRRLPILVMAAEKRVVDGYREALRLAGLQMAALEPLSLAASRSVFPALEHGGIAILVVGAHVTEFSVFHNGALRYSRRIDVGSQELAQPGAGTHSPQVESEIDASVGPALPRLDRPSGDQQSLVNEVQRSLGFYHREAPASQRVERVLVCANPQTVQDLKGPLEASLGLPAVPAEPFKNTLYSDAKFNPELLTKTGPAYAPAMGLALRMIEETPRAPRMDLSITGTESRMARVAPKWLIWALVSSVVLVIAVAIGLWMVNQAVQRRQAELGAAKQELVRVSREEQERTSAAKRAREAQSIVQLRGLPWSDILFQVSASMPEHVWLSSLAVDSGNTLSLNGSALAATSVATLMESLTRSPLFSGPQMSSITKESSRGLSVVRYQVKVGLTPPTPSSAGQSPPGQAVAPGVPLAGGQSSVGGAR